MEPQFQQYEFDLRLYLTHRDAVGKLDWIGLGVEFLGATLGLSA